MLRSLWKLLFEMKSAPAVPATVEERLDEVERAVHSLKLEWLETSDKVERWMHRSIKRAQVEQLDPQNLVSPPSSETNGVDPISAEILRRRGRVRGAGQPGP
jgi:hypothetical protein